MRYIAFALFMLFITMPSFADCFNKAGHDFQIDPNLLRAIAWNESKINTNAIGYNKIHGYGIGLMQIDSQHFHYLLSQFGITQWHLKHDACINIYTGAYFLSLAFNKWGRNWRAVGAYNAGFAKTKKQEKKRNIYISKIKSTYSIINGNGTSSSVFEKLQN
ncbi:transglycosylase SLT domain-containing protein [Serratia ficaria]|uniref:transglycosylase SLT domain-containing protein n=1 Tax=Serratia ficaria TaxID=61651 RepID=UPI00093CFBBF|nr:transglycosylase SLT domain-containing protein [Serratia ficaria]